MFELRKERVQAFFNYAKKRYQLMLDKEGGFPKPWTDDPILQQYRFCNVFREDDKTTRWFKNNIRDELFYDPSVVYATTMFRWFNKIETGELLLNKGGDKLKLFTDFQPKEILSRLEGVSPVITAAYMIKTPAGMKKAEGIVWCLERSFNLCLELGEQMLENVGSISLEAVHDRLMTLPYLGEFMAYEIVTDLRHTALLQDAPDIMTWANPGPGAARGLDRLLGQELYTFNRSRDADREIMMGLMQQLLKCSQKEEYWPKRWPKWEMREVEHTLCELDKYERALSGEGRPKQKYAGK